MNGPYIFLAYASLFFMATLDNARGPIFPDLLQTFQINSSQGSWVFTLSSLISFFLAITVTHWLKKLGSTNATKLAVLSGASSSIIMAWAGSRTDGFIFFLIGVFLLGLCMGITSITVNLLVVKNCQLSKQRQVLSGLHAMYGLASLLSPAIIAFFFARQIPWQFLFYGIGGLGLLLFINSIKTPNQSAKVGESDQKAPLALFLLVGGVFAMYVCAEVLTATRLVQFQVEGRGLDKSIASGQLGLFFFLVLLGRFAATVLGSRYPSAILMMASLVSSMVLVVLGLTIFPQVLAWSGLGMSIFYPIAISWITSLTPRYADDLISKLMIGVGASLTILHFGFGFLSDYYGISSAMRLVPVFLFISLILLIFTHTSVRVAKLAQAS